MGEIPGYFYAQKLRVQEKINERFYVAIYLIL